MQQLGIHAALSARAIPLALAPVRACAYCWRVAHAHDGQPYPARLSSTICPEHVAWIKGQRTRRNV